MIVTIEPIHTDAGWAIVVGNPASGYVVVKATSEADATTTRVVSESPFNPRRLRRVAVPATTALHEQTVTRWECIHGTTLTPAPWR